MQSTLSTSLETVVYIDGFNLYYSLKNTPYKWLNLKKLIENILNPSLHKILNIKYFTAIPMRSDSAQRQSVYLRVLKTLEDIEIVFGQFKKRQVKGLLSSYNKGKYVVNKNKIETITKWEEKKSDVNIASHIVYDCCRSNVDCDLPPKKRTRYQVFKSFFVFLNFFGHN